MRGILSRGLRLHGFAGLALALAIPALAADNQASQPTQTTLSAETRDQSGRTQAALQVSVTGEDGQPATGAIGIEDAGKELAGAALDASGHARLTLDLPAGDHALRAVYFGDSAHQGSASEVAGVHANAGSTPDFSVAATPTKLSLNVGQSGEVTALITPTNNSSLTSPMFVTLSCQGLPDQASCTFTPENIEILSTSCPNPKSSSCPIQSKMVIQTQLGTGKLERWKMDRSGNPVNWAFLLPGALALIGLAKGRGRLRNLSLVLLLGAVSVLGASACNSRYNYFNHGPPPNPPTPAGTYTVTVKAQSNNGITATTHTATMSLTVN